MNSATRDKPIVVLVGPTAGGKTALSVELASRLPGGGECISADSMQVYRGMDIGTATPTVEERGNIPHHLLDVVAPNEPWSLDDWLVEAERAIADVRQRGRWPIVVGGTNLYVQGLLFGLLDGPAPDPDLRASLAALPLDQLRARLKAVDPVAADRIHPNDTRRAIRALEYAEGTGSPLSAAQVQWEDTCRPDARILGLEWPTEDINRRINARVGQMMALGLLEEVRSLDQEGLLGPQTRTAVGYAQLLNHLQGTCTLEEAVEQIKIRTRRLGKQQRTWLRRFRALPDVTWLQPAESSIEVLVAKALTCLLEAPGGERTRA